MTDAEITRVARLMLTADGGCAHCVGCLIEALAVEFPEHAKAINRVMAEWLEADDPGVGNDG